MHNYQGRSQKQKPYSILCIDDSESQHNSIVNPFMQSKGKYVYVESSEPSMTYSFEEEKEIQSGYGHRIGKYMPYMYDNFEITISSISSEYSQTGDFVIELENYDLCQNIQKDDDCQFLGSDIQVSESYESSSSSEQQQSSDSQEVQIVESVDLVESEGADQQPKQQIPLKKNKINQKKKVKLSSFKNKVQSLKEEEPKQPLISMAKRSFPTALFQELVDKQKKQVQQIKRRKQQNQRARQRNLLRKKNAKERANKKPEVTYNLSVHKAVSHAQLINSLKRSPKLQQILNTHHHKKSQLVECILFNNSYFTNSVLKIPQAPRIPNKFDSVGDYQRIMTSNIKNQLYYELREKLKHIQLKSKTFAFYQQEQRIERSERIFQVLIKGQQKGQNGIYYLNAMLYVPTGQKVHQFHHHVVRNYVSRHRIFVLINEEKRIKVMCQIRNAQKQNKFGDFEQISLILAAGVDIFGKQKPNDGKFEPFDALLYSFGKIITPIRQYEAVCNLKESPLVTQILNPSISFQSKTTIHDFKVPSQKLQSLLEKGFNSSQFKAIKEITSKQTGIELLQGPPGTGKTATLLGLLSAQYQRLQYYNHLILSEVNKKPNVQSLTQLDSPQNFPKILICAPSNSAVDLITLRILQNSIYYGKQIRKEIEIVRTNQLQFSKKGNNIINLTEKQSLKPQKYTFISQRKLPRLLRVGLAPDAQKRTHSSPQTLEQLTHPNNFNLYLIIGAVFEREQRSNMRYMTLDQLRDKIKFVQEQIKYIKCTIAEVCEPANNENEIKCSPIVNILINLLQLRQKISQTLQKISSKPPSPHHHHHNPKHSTTYPLKSLIHAVQKSLLCHSEILLSTLTTSLSEKITSTNPTFTCLIIDEAAQATEPNTLVPLQYGMGKVILIGDQCQLPPTIMNVELMKTLYNRSLFERLWQYMKDTPTSIHMLQIQYRMCPKIRQFPSLYFYQNRLLDSESVQQRKDYSYNQNCNWNNKVCFIDCVAGREHNINNSYANRVQGEIVVSIVRQIMKAEEQRCGESKSKLSIGVITPYSEQSKLIKSLLKRSITSTLHPQPTISTVDSYQGQQRDLIIISTVRSNSHNKIGFLTDERRINVALTRAKYGLIVVGNADTLRGTKIWEQYVAWVRKIGGYVRVEGGEGVDLGEIFGGNGEENGGIEERSMGQQLWKASYGSNP